MKANEHNILQVLKGMNLEPKVQDQTGQIYTVFEHEGGQFPTFFRLLHEGDLIQMITFVPYTVTRTMLGDVGRFLHMINKELDLPGFCLDESSTTVFYRLVLPTSKKEFQQESFEALLNTSRLVITSFATVIAGLAVGATSLDEILAKVSETQGKAKGRTAKATAKQKS